MVIGFIAPAAALLLWVGSVAQFIGEGAAKGR